ncbi:hypothetical protein F1C58_16220 (plasmid) [Glaciihabitans sp. INWT7]|uniref:hypothetical protein n=1 Tax=Glaciihabitans sp. INWT7 TaxID=2596912 RepID=UPI001629CC33|nr:hypothetical protein [Glaciihabitans sp. INWT7]QNE48605.1 hypothetical protein F1C58_16220 [Glaciihabitans sp. INWT7]
MTVTATPTRNRTPSALAHRITTVREVEDLVTLLRSPARTTPVVAVSTQNREDVPLIDADRIAEALGNTATVFLIKTGSLTYAFADLMVEGSHVYGGAGRVYQPGTAWEEDLRRSPLRFAYDAAGGASSTEQLIDDAAIPRGQATPPTGAANSAFSAEQLELLARASAAAASAPVTAPLAAAESAPAQSVTPAILRSEPVVSDVPRTEPAPQRLSGIAAVAASTQPIAIVEPSEAPSPGRKTGALNDALLTITALKATNASLQATIAAGRAQALNDCADRMNEAIVENARLVRQLSDIRARNTEQLSALRKKNGKVETAASDFRPELFPTEADAVKHEVYLAWVARVPANEKPTTPLPDFSVGTEFVNSLEKLSPGQFTKAMKCVVDVLCDLARESRGIHPLRGTAAADVGGIVRADGAVCFRAYVEQKASSARRLHYWKLVDGTIELSRVVTHDDMKP